MADIPQNDLTGAPLTPEELAQALANEKDAHEQTKTELADALEKHADATEALTTSANKQAELEDQLSEAELIIEGQTNTITELTAKIQSLQANPEEFPIIEVGKDKYEIRAKAFKYNRVEYTAADLTADKKLQAELVEKGAGFLVKKEQA